MVIVLTIRRIWREYRDMTKADIYRIVVLTLAGLTLIGIFSLMNAELYLREYGCPMRVESHEH